MIIIQLSALISKGQWTTGHVHMYNSTNINTGYNVTAGNSGASQQDPCHRTAGSDIPANAETCMVNAQVDTGLDVFIDYGLFGNIRYQTSSTVTTTSTYTFYDSTGTLVQINNENDFTNSDDETNQNSYNTVIQKNYHDWALCNKTWINNVRATRAFLIISFICMIISFVYYYRAIYKINNHPRIYSSLRKGFYWLLLSSFSCFVCYIAWVAIPRSAFLNVYADRNLFSTAQPEIFDPQSADYECIMMSDFYQYTVDPQLNRHGFMWQIVFFGWFFSTLTLYIWRRLFSSIKKSPFEIQNLPGGDSFETDYSYSSSENLSNFSTSANQLPQQNPLGKTQSFRSNNYRLEAQNNIGPVVSI